MSVQLELPMGTRRQVDVIGDLSDYDDLPAPRAKGSSPSAPPPRRRSPTHPDNRALRRAAAARIRVIAVSGEERAKLTPEQVADVMTSMADARIALCVAQGNSLDDIDPSSGYSLSRESYERVRQSWRNQAKQPGWSEHLRPGLEEVIAYWSERRPEFTEGDDWLGDLIN